MVQPTRPPRNEFNRVMRRIYNPIGFTKAYNFILWFIFSGALFGFLLSRAPFIDFNGVFCGAKYASNGLLHAAPGECWKYYSDKKLEFGIRLHLTSIIPAGFLALMQFIPAIRHKVILVHRITGYTVITLVLISHVGAIMIAPVAFGGTFDTRVFVGAVVIMTTTTLSLALINIKRLQIEQHRAYMLRTWFYLSCIVTQRLILFSGAPLLTKFGAHWSSTQCGKIGDVLGSPEHVNKYYPECAGSSNSTIQAHKYVIVQALWDGRGEQKAATLDQMFGGALWLALLLHAIGVEVYLRLTPAETERLRMVSYQRQLARGMRHPGSAGTTSDRFGDAKEYQPVGADDPSKERLRHKADVEAQDDDSDTSYRGASF